MFYGPWQVTTHNTRDPKRVFAKLVDGRIRIGGDVPDVHTGIMTTLTAGQSETRKEERKQVITKLSLLDISE